MKTTAPEMSQMNDISVFRELSLCKYRDSGSLWAREEAMMLKLFLNPFGAVPGRDSYLSGYGGTFIFLLC